MKCRARIALTFEDAATADAVKAALTPDDASFVTTVAEGVTVTAEVEADGPMSLLRTLDDWLASAAVAGKAARAGKLP